MFEGEYHHTWCFAHVNQLVARAFVGQFEVKEVSAEDSDVLVNEDVRALVELAENLEEEERETRRARAWEMSGEEAMLDGLDEDEEDDDEEWLSEVASLSDEEREDFEHAICPVKMALVKVSGARSHAGTGQEPYDQWGPHRFGSFPSKLSTRPPNCSPYGAPSLKQRSF